MRILSHRSTFLFTYLLGLRYNYIISISSPALCILTSQLQSWFAICIRISLTIFIRFKINTKIDYTPSTIIMTLLLCQLGNSFRKIKFRSPEMKSDQTMARRMTLIVLTDFFCWVPIILLGVASLLGANIEPQVSTIVLTEAHLLKKL